MIILKQSVTNFGYPSLILNNPTDHIHHPKCEKQRLVDILKNKKQTSIIVTFFKIFKRFCPTFSQNFQSI